jgi:hypothetical protein
MSVKKLNPPFKCYEGDKGPLVIKAGPKNTISPEEYQMIFGDSDDAEALSGITPKQIGASERKRLRGR